MLIASATIDKTSLWGKGLCMMSTKIIEVKPTQTYLTELLSLVIGGTEVILTQGDAPIARLVPVALPPASTQRVPGLHLGAIWMSDDFDAPLPDDFWLGEKV